MRLGAETLLQCRRDARLADAGFAGDQHNLAVAHPGAPPAAQQQVNLLVTADQPGQRRSAQRLKPARNDARTQHLPCWHRGGDALDFDRAEIAVLEKIPDQCRFTAVVPVMAKGFNHATQLAISAAASAGKLFGLSAGEIANAIAIATVDNVSLACVHVEPVSQWKGFSPGMTGMRAVYAASLAKRGFTGPNRLFEGPKGLEHMFAQSIPVDWEDPSLDFITQTVMKKYCSLIHGQPVLEAVLDLKRSSGLVAAEVEHVRCDIFQAGFDFAGGGSYGSKDHPWTKEQGDYNLKYLISAALLDGQVGPAQLEAARIQAPDAQAMVARVEVRPDEQFTVRFPEELCARITVRTKDQRLLVKEHLGYEGGLDNPMSWDRTVEKFHWLSEGFADADLRGRLIQAVRQLDTSPISDLMGFLAQVRPTAVFPKTHPGFQ